MDTTSDRELEHRLERGGIVTFSPCPFALPIGDDLAFLMQQQVNSRIHKNISYNPTRDTASGFVRQSPLQSTRLTQLLREFSTRASAWLADLLPLYAKTWQPDRASLRTEEEAIRKLRLTARNDLLHFDAFPSRPTHGKRILRLYVNINPTDDRVWVTSDTFANVLDKYGGYIGLPDMHTTSWMKRIGKGLSGLFQPGALGRTDYDDFMLRLHHFLKSNDDFQERSLRHLWHFKPGAAWLLFADAISHAELRGRFALEHSFFVAPEGLALPDESPFALLSRKRASASLPRVA